MSFITLKKDNKLVLKYVPKDDIIQIDMDAPLENYVEYPSVEMLKALPRDVLERMMKFSGFVGATSHFTKCNKEEMASMLVKRWDVVSKSFALDAGCVALLHPDAEL